MQGCEQVDGVRLVASMAISPLMIASSADEGSRKICRNGRSCATPRGPGSRVGVFMVALRWTDSRAEIDEPTELDLVAVHREVMTPQATLSPALPVLAVAAVAAVEFAVYCVGLVPSGMLA